MPIAAEVARVLDAPLDVLIALKTSPPGKPELSAGATAAGGVRVENRDIIESLAIPQEEVDAMAARALAEIPEREQELRGHRGPPSLEGRRAILVDEGLAGSALMLAAVAAARIQGAVSVVVAAPIGAAPVIDELGREADQVVCAAIAEQFFTISQFYEDFAELGSEPARAVLLRAWGEGLEPDRKLATAVAAL